MERSQHARGKCVAHKVSLDGEDDIVGLRGHQPLACFSIARLGTSDKKYFFADGDGGWWIGG